VDWYDLDYPDVIALSRQFYDETGQFHLIPSSVTDLRWTDTAAKKSWPVLIIAEGLFMYLHEEELSSLLLPLQRTFSESLHVFDCFSRYTAKSMADHPSMQKTGAVVFWGIDNATEIGHWNKGIMFLEEWDDTRSDEIKKFAAVYRVLFKIAGLFSPVKKPHCILVFRLEDLPGPLPG
jgi:O-methyltransferase involved in polyketide biosynthesis